MPSVRATAGQCVGGRGLVSSPATLRESHSVGEHSAAAPAVVSTHSQLPAARLATLQQDARMDARRWVPLLLAHECGLLTRQSPGGWRPNELQGTATGHWALPQWHWPGLGRVRVGGGPGSRDRYSTTCSRTHVSVPRLSPPTAGPYPSYARHGILPRSGPSGTDAPLK